MIARESKAASHISKLLSQSGAHARILLGAPTVKPGIMPHARTAGSALRLVATLRQDLLAAEGWSEVCPREGRTPASSPRSSLPGMGWIKSFFSSNGDMHQVMRTGELINDLTTGQSGFIVSDAGGISLVTDQRGGLHQIMKNGSVSTDLTTGTTYFEI